MGEETDETTEKQQEMEDMTVVVRPSDEVHPGRRKAYLVVLAGWEIGREIELTGREHVFGRSFMADTRVSSPSVSREHAKIVCTGEGSTQCYVITDLGSSNGTTVNNVPVTVTRLSNGDKIQMGDVLFKFVLADEADARFYKDIHRLIHYDQLTGLMTMEAFRRRLEAEMQKCAADGGTLSLAMTDLDGLKRVNDTYGHLAGRMVVREMGNMIRHSIRPQDLPALYGGDECVIFFRDTPIAEAEEVAERIRQTIEAHRFDFRGRSFHVTISQGLAQWPGHGGSVEELISAADGALYAAKAAGRNCVRHAMEMP